MLFIQLETLSLYIIDKKNKLDLEFVKKLFHNEDIKKWVHGISNVLNDNINGDFFGHGFIIKDGETYIGYVGIGEYYSDEKCVYLRYGIDKEVVGNGYGKKILSEITEYTFLNYPDVEKIKLKIDRANIPSLKTANSCGYKWLSDDFYIKYTPYVHMTKK